MTYVLKRPAPARPARGYIETGEHGFQTPAATITVHPDDEDTVWTGLVTAAGDAIHRQVKQPVGFIRHKG